MSIGRPERNWPRGAVDLLLRANLKDEAIARAAWRQWTATRDFDEIDWWEMRLLVPLAQRLRTIDPDTPLLPRIDGLAKHLWTRTYLAIREVNTVFARLDREGIPFIVFKGGAQYAEGLTGNIRRIMGDVDLLVPGGRTVDTLHVLAEEGWTSTNAESFEYLTRLANVRISSNFKKGRHGDVDLHNTPFHFARTDAQLDRELWSRSRVVQLLAQPIRVPDPTDTVLLLLAHSAQSGSGDWAIDLATRMEKQAIDWRRLAELAARRGLVPVCRSSLRYLREELDLPVPASVLDDLASRPVSLAERIKHWANVGRRAERNTVEKLVERLADRALGPRGFSFYMKDRRSITVVRSRLALALPFRAKRRLDSLPADIAPDHRLALAGVRPGQRLVLRLAMAEPEVSRRIFFDLAIDGVGVARLRTRAGGSGTGREIERRFSLPLPQGTASEASLDIMARPVRYGAPGIPDAERRAIAPIPFRILGAWIVGGGRPK